MAARLVSLKRKQSASAPKKSVEKQGEKKTKVVKEKKAKKPTKKMQEAAEWSEMVKFMDAAPKEIYKLVNDYIMATPFLVNRLCKASANYTVDVSFSNINHKRVEVVRFEIFNRDQPRRQAPLVDSDAEPDRWTGRVVTPQDWEPVVGTVPSLYKVALANYLSPLGNSKLKEDKQNESKISKDAEDIFTAVVCGLCASGNGAELLELYGLCPDQVRIGATGKSGRAIQNACRRGHVDILVMLRTVIKVPIATALLPLYSEPDKLGSRGCHAMTLACNQGRADVVRELRLGWGATRALIFGAMGLFHAVASGSLETVTELIDGYKATTQDFVNSGAPACVSFVRGPRAVQIMHKLLSSFADMGDAIKRNIARHCAHSLRNPQSITAMRQGLGLTASMFFHNDIKELLCTAAQADNYALLRDFRLAGIFRHASKEFLADALAEAIGCRSVNSARELRVGFHMSGADCALALKPKQLEHARSQMPDLFWS